MVCNMVNGLGVVINLLFGRVMVISNLHGFGLISRFRVRNIIGLLVSRGFVLVRLSLIRLDLSFVFDVSDESRISIDVVSHHLTATIGKINEVASLGAVPLTALFGSVVVVVIILDSVFVLVVSRSLESSLKNLLKLFIKS